MDKPLILEADRLMAYERIAELEQMIIDLGPEIEAALNQSSETYHDNAPFEVVRDRRSNLIANIRELRDILVHSTKQMPPKRAGVVSVDTSIEVQNGTTMQRHRYYLAGDWTLRTGTLHQGALVLSRKSPLGALLEGKKVGAALSFNGAILTILSVN